MFYPINEDFADETSYLEFEVDIGHFFSKSGAMALSQSGGVLAVDWKGGLLSAPPAAMEFSKDVTEHSSFRQIDFTVAGYGDLTYGGSSYRYVVKPIERLHASLVGLVPHSEIDSPWIKTRNVYLLLIVFLVIMLAAISFLLAGLLIRKIVRIVGNVRKIQNGNFQVRIPVHGEDEIDWLALNINSMAGQIDELINRVYKSQVSQKDAELKALQAQINPHFLFNTLETLRMMAETGDQPKLSDAITALGSIMRYNIYNGKEPVTLATEIEHIHDYVQIQNLLLNQRVSLDVSVPERLQSYRIPNLLLQPLVENCIIHGMKGIGGRRLSIEIVIEERLDQIHCAIMDNGRGIDPERLDEIRSQLLQPPDKRSPTAPDSDKNKETGRSGGIGLANVRDRIQYYFGPSSEMDLDSSREHGTVVTLTLPAGTAS
jgi:two-component system sensor histidine kinase YesM